MNLVAYQHKKSQMSGIQLTAATQEDIERAKKILRNLGINI